VEEAENPVLFGEYQSMLIEAREAREGSMRAINAAYEEKVDAIRAQAAGQAGANIEALRAAAAAAERAWEDHDSPQVLTDDEGDLVLCALTGVALFEDDPVLEDEHTGEKVLKAALGVPLDADNEDRFVPAAAAA